MDINKGQAILELLDDEQFQAILRLFMRRAIPWHEFLELPMPDNVSPAVTWEILKKMSRTIAVSPLIQDPEDRDFWYRRTYEITDIANSVALECRTGSRLHQTMTGSEGQHFMVRARIEDACAAAKADGLLVSEREIKTLLRSLKTPKSDAEQLIVNAYKLFDRLPDYMSERFSPELLREFQDLLLDGVEQGGIAHGPRRFGLMPYQYPGEITPRDAEGQLELICAYLNHEHGDERDHVVVRARDAVDAMAYIRPLQVASCQVGRLASSLYAMKQDIPVLAFLPDSRVRMDWEDGRIGPPAVPYDAPTLREQWHLFQPHDMTAHHTMTVYLQRLALDEMNAHIAEWERRDAEIHRIMRCDPELNQRQRSILSRAMRNPQATFRIAYHRTNHNIAYATARRDLIALEDRGYLRSELRGKALVFLPSESLAELVDQA